MTICAAATTTVAAVAVTTAKDAPPATSQGPFQHPSEYLAALHAIGWRATAMYALRPDGSQYSMGVNESSGTAEHGRATWLQFHVIQMRTPIQNVTHARPLNGWWKDVWQHLWDLGHREDVTPELHIANGGDDDDAS